MTDEDTLRAVQLASHLGGRLRASLASLVPFLPFDAAQVVAANETMPDATDAFLQPFGNLVNHLQDQAWRLIAVDEGFRDPSEMSRRDIAEFAAKLGLLTSYEDFREVVRVRNRLSQVYPDDPARQARRLTECIGTSTLLLDCVDRIEAWAAARGITPPASP